VYVLSRTRFIVFIVSLIVLIILLRILIDIIDRTSVLNIPRNIVEILKEHRVFDIILALVLGIVAIQFTASFVHSILKHHGRSAYLVRNVVLVIGYIILALIIGILLGLSGESILASATFSGLIIGLALQPVLSNFFSGLIILTTGYLKPGQEIRLAGLPLSVLPLPSYKFFSRDTIIPNIRGTVVEIGFLYTKIIDTDGNLVKVSNNILLNNSIVLEETEEERRIQVRYEFPITCDPDIVISELQSVLNKKLGNYKLYIEEQSDKTHYIVLLTTITPPKISGRLYRSDILKEIIKVHKKLLFEKKCVETYQ